MAELKWENVVKQYENMIKYASRVTYQKKLNVDASITPDDLYQVGMLKLYDCFMRYGDKNDEEFGKLTKTAIYHELNYVCKESRTYALENKEGEEIDVPVETDFDKKETHALLESIEKQLKRETSKQVLKELINPSRKTINVMLQDIANKKMLAQQGKKVNIPKTTDIKQRHIRESLGLTQKQFDKAIKEVRDVASKVFEIENNFFKTK